MEKYIIDWEEGAAEKCAVIIKEDGKLINAVPSGVIVINTPDDNPIYSALELDFNIKFCRDMKREELPFYTVPMLAVFASDSYGNVFGTLGGLGDLADDDYPVAMVTKDNRIFTVADCLRDFLSLAVCGKSDFREKYGFSGFNATKDMEDNRKYISDMLGLELKCFCEKEHDAEIFNSKVHAGEKYRFIR